VMGREGETEEGRQCGVGVGVGGGEEVGSANTFVGKKPGTQYVT
jgi:hypothetical protein